MFIIKIYCNDTMHKSFLIPPSINRILGKNRKSVNLTYQTAVLNFKNEDLSPSIK